MGQEPTFADNMRMAGRALQQFEQVLKRDPSHRLAMFQSGCAFYYTGNIEEARNWFRRIIQSNPRDADALVALGYADVSAAARVYFPASTLTTLAPLPISDAAQRQPLRDKWLPVLAEAEQVLNAAVTLNANDEDALVFLHHTLDRKSKLADTLLEHQALERDVDIAKERATGAKGKGTRPHGINVRLDATLPPPALAFVPSLP